MRCLGSLLCVLCSVPLHAQIAPAPKQLEFTGGTCSGSSIRCAVAEFRPQVTALIGYLEKLGAKDIAQTTEAGADEVLVIRRGSAGGAEGYRIATANGTLVVTAESPHGVARAAASLVHLAKLENNRLSWPALRLQDAPDRPFRCFMIDMGRNPHGPQTLRQVVDAAWFYKVNYLHLHLADDQLFSWPSKAFPKLYSQRAGWTWNDFVALEEYSQARGVTIIPEIDVPGHSTILRRMYPDVFGKSPTELATRPGAQRGMEQLIAELLSVFRATPYFHIGGDEAYGVPGNTQRDFINRLNRFIKSQGKRTLVWEGPHLGTGKHKVATDVIHLNWRTIDFPAQEMLAAGYQVVNAAWDPLYIVDHYPRTMFTAVDVGRCYDWDIRRFAHVNHQMPTFGSPHVTKTDQGILGFCMPWWEGRQQNLMSLCVPRLAAVASAAWNRQGERDFTGFRSRKRELLPRLETLAGVHFASLPTADAKTQTGNLAFRAKVTPSSGASQPVFGPMRLTNGLTDRFDHFLGYPTKPEPLAIVVDLGAAAKVGRIVVHETAVGQSHEVYDVLVSADGGEYVKVGAATKGSRGKQSHVEHVFAARETRFIKIRTSGCHGLTFPSFSRLTEIEAFAK